MLEVFTSQETCIVLESVATAWTFLGGAPGTKRKINYIVIISIKGDPFTLI